MIASGRKSAIALPSSLHAAFPMMHKTVFQWLGTLLFLPASKQLYADCGAMQKTRSNLMSLSSIPIYKTTPLAPRS
jgi:hypothetical protein